MIDTGPHLWWYVSRGTGIVAFLLLLAAVCLGIALSRRWHSAGVPRLIVDEAHRWVVIAFYLLVVVHVVALYLDRYIDFRVADLLVPFLSGYRTLWTTLGIVGAELAVAVGASVWVRRRIGYRAWHALHGLSYPIFLFSLLHGIGTGSDTTTAWATALYAGSAACALAAVVWRVAGRRAMLATAFGAGAFVVSWMLTGTILPH